MGCPICTSAGWIGGWIGGYFGIHPPEYPGGKILSALITANLTTITVIALKSFFNFSLHVGRDLSKMNIAIVLLKTILIGSTYSVAVNYILNRWVYPKPIAEPEKDQSIIPSALKELGQEASKEKSCCKTG